MPPLKRQSWWFTGTFHPVLFDLMQDLKATVVLNWLLTAARMYV